jgi:TatD DNase family protein
MGLFDVHAHLTSAEFAGELPSVLARARAAGVTTIISNGLNVADNQRVLELAASEPLVRPALGFYPVDAVLPEMRRAGVQYPREPGAELDADATLAWLDAHASQAFALGEIGLDHYWVPEQFWERQESVFRRLLELALAHDLPVILHSRKAERRTLELLRELGVTRADWHCFSSRLKLGREIAEAGHFLSIPANAPRSETFTGLLRSARRDRLLLETDCPYLAPVAGARSEPRDVEGTLGYAAELWGVSVERALAQFEENFEALFGVRP